MLLYGGFLLKPDPSLKIYGELLIDDINFHQKNAFYLNRYAYLLGIQKHLFHLLYQIFGLKCQM